MSNQIQGLNPKECFTLFTSDPTNQPVDVLQSTHKYLVDSKKRKVR